MMLFIYATISFFISWIWVDYYRLIDIYEKERLSSLLITFFLGGLSVLLVFAIDDLILEKTDFKLSGDFLNDFAYCTLAIGLVEEFSKACLFVPVYFLFKKQINEPIDFVAYFCIVALGFAAVENTLYFFNHGPQLIEGRAILATVSHMFDAALAAYGVIYYKYHHNKPGIIVVLLYFSLAVLSHGFYDFWLMYEYTRTGGWIITVLFYLVTISLFAVIINNALNNSTFFTYKKVVNSTKVAGRLLTYYGILFAVQFILITIERDWIYAMADFQISLFTAGYVIIITCVRLSRFKLIHKRWHQLRLEFPFHLYGADPMSGKIFTMRIKGDSFNETHINAFYEEHCLICPVSKRKTTLVVPRKAYIEKKVFLKHDETFYMARIHFETGTDLVLLKAKTRGTFLLKDKYPVVAVLKPRNPEDMEDDSLTVKDFRFLEWAAIRPFNEE